MEPPSSDAPRGSFLERSASLQRLQREQREQQEQRVEASEGSAEMNPSEYETLIREERARRRPVNHPVNHPVERKVQRPGQRKSPHPTQPPSRGRESGTGLAGRRLPRSHSGSGLASARDRQRVRERNAAERARVERMLASAPLSRSLSGSPQALPGSAARGSVSLRALPSPGCPVCCSGRTASDEVYQQGTLRLWECLHCDHRWTERPSRRWAEIGASMARGAASTKTPSVRPRILRSA